MPGVTGPLRLVVMGTGPFAVPMLQSLRRSPHAIAAVVTRPDHAPPGRRPPPNPIREAAAGLPILAPERVNDGESVAALRAFAADLFVVCDYGQLLSAELLAVPPLGGINLHGSLLPRHRGAAPIQWAILEGDAVTGVSVIHMTPALDAGNVIASRPLAVGPRDTAADLEPRLAAIGAEAVVEAIERLAAAMAATGSAAGVGVPQAASQATRAPRLTKAQGVVDWTWEAARIERLRRALEPWPRTATFFTRGDGLRQRLVLADVDVASHPAAVRATPGEVLDTGGGRILVACGRGTALAITQVVPEGRRDMTAADFLRGSPLLPGMRLG